MTVNGELLGLPEYATHIAAASKTHVICLLDYDNAKHACIHPEDIEPDADYLEFELRSRPGQSRVYLAFKTTTEPFCEYFKNMRKNDGQNVF